MPARHTAHDIAPSLEYVPLAHRVGTLEPSHHEPAGQREHDWRVIVSPPPVYEPDGHSLQLVAPSLLYMVSSPHGEHALEPTAA